MVDLHLSLLVAVLKAELDVLAHGLTFLLGKARHNRKEHLALSIQCVYGLLFKIDRYVLVLELPDVLQAVEGVSGKSADGLGDDHVDVSGHALLNHAVELFTLFDVGTGDTIVYLKAVFDTILFYIQTGSNLGGWVQIPNFATDKARKSTPHQFAECVLILLMFFTP